MWAELADLTISMSLDYNELPWLETGDLTCIIREVEGARSLLCYKHVIKTVFGATEEASA